MEEVLVVLEDLTEIATKQAPVKGELVLLRRGPEFFLSWSPTPQVPQFVARSHSYGDSWTPFSAFTLPVTSLEFVVFKSDPLAFMLLRKHQRPREFTTPASLFYLSIFIEQLILNACAVVADDRVLLFHLLVSPPFDQPCLDLQSRDFETFDAFWSAVESLQNDVFRFLETANLISKDAKYAMTIAGKASFLSIMRELEKSTGPDQPKLSNLDSLFDPDGRVLEIEKLRSTLFFNGVDPSVLTALLPWIVRLFSGSETADERRSLQSEMSAEFDTYVRQASQLLDGPIRATESLKSAFRVINRDIARTEKTSPAFQDAQSSGNVALARILQAYCVFNPSVAYVQGMSDLLHPILSVCMDEFDLSKASWCFDTMLRTTTQFAPSNSSRPLSRNRSV
jgi:hypothetical protein